MNKFNLTANKIIIGVAIVFGLGVLGWVYMESNRPQPGEKLEDLGREHVPIGTEVKYNSNPPTSGSHYEDWIRAGIYDKPMEDRNLVHSLEHGSVVMSYNCDFGKQVDQENNEATTSAQTASPSADLSNEFSSEECKKLISDLTQIYEQKGKRKLIVVPRPNLDEKIALTAWGRLDKFNDFNQKRIEQFLDAYRDRGPEQAME
jgi:hypothetical protein